MKLKLFVATAVMGTVVILSGCSLVSGGARVDGGVLYGNGAVSAPAADGTPVPVASVSASANLGAVPGLLTGYLVKAYEALKGVIN